MTNSVDPIILSMRLSDPCEPPVCSCGDGAEVPAGIAGCFPGELNMGGEGRRVYGPSRWHDRTTRCPGR